jgi:hypothetical protein
MLVSLPSAVDRLKQKIIIFLIKKYLIRPLKIYSAEYHL